LFRIILFCLLVRWISDCHLHLYVVLDSCYVQNCIGYLFVLSSLCTTCYCIFVTLDKRALQYHVSGSESCLVKLHPLGIYLRVSTVRS